MRRAVILAAALMLAACQTTEPLTPELPPDPCVPSAAAELEPPVARVTPTPDQRLQMDMAGIRAMGEELYRQYVLGESQHEARGERVEARVVQTREWCLTRG